jgi:hypothetical protein
VVTLIAGRVARLLERPGSGVTPRAAVHRLSGGRGAGGPRDQGGSCAGADSALKAIACQLRRQVVVFTISTDSSRFSHA